MKLSILAIVGAFASANAAVIRGDVAAKKLALLQQLTHVANKNTFRFARRQLEENQNGENNEFTKDTTITPVRCVTATVYNSDNNGNNNGYSYANKATVSYLTFTAGTAGSSAEYNGQYGEAGKYITSLPQYLSDIGQAYAEEMMSFCTTCEQLDYFCNDMSDEERQSFADMTDDEWTEYVEEQEQKQQEQKQQQQQQQQQKNQEQQAAQMGAYYAYQGMSGASNNNENSGNRKLYSMAEGVCDTCSEKCVDDEEEQQDEEYYKQLLEFFTDTMCMETSDGSGYIGHTCGSTGLGIELALFEDKNCMYLAANQDAYSVYESTMAQYSDQNNNGDSLGFDYMTMVTDMYSQQFSCTEGSEYGGYGDTEPSEICQNLFEGSISASECQNENQNYENQNDGNGNDSNVPDGYDMNYSENVGDNCAKILQLEANLANMSNKNPFNGQSFLNAVAKSTGLSPGAIAGIVIAVLAVVAGVAAFAWRKRSTNKDLEEPIYTGGALN